MSSSPVTLTFPAACSGAPQVVTNFLAYRAGGTLWINWDSPANGVAPTGYILTVTGSYVGSIPTTPKALSGAVPPGSYHISVVATNACGVGPGTPPVTVVVP